MFGRGAYLVQYAVNPDPYLEHRLFRFNMNIAGPGFYGKIQDLGNNLGNFLFTDKPAMARFKGVDPFFLRYRGRYR